MANQFTKGRRDHHFDVTREKIQAANIIHRLQDCVDGKAELSSQQVAAAKTLLAKVLPDLQATKITADADTRYVALMPEVCESAEEWQRRYAPKTVLTDTKNETEGA